MRRLLIANRGEIAVRIARSARALGIETIAVVSEADRQSFVASLADAVELIGPSPAHASYLDQDAVLAALHRSGADAVHPGYGFLSENAEFARRVLAAGATWVGPSPETIELMGDKAAAIAAARSAGVPVISGSDGTIDIRTDTHAIAERVGYPLLIKASGGGGGRGIRMVKAPSELRPTLDLARAEAQAAFGDSRVYLERFIPRARHVEVQVLGDGQRAIHLGDRDCSTQRRSQKLVEEAPAPQLPPHVRESIRTAAVRLAESCGYEGAGTVEYLYDPVREEAAFIEMNTRLQVEHPVTEAITGLDIVAEQLRIASGEPLTLSQEEVQFNGHAIECRINAEDPQRGFFPSPGVIESLRWPPGVRVDSGYESGNTIPPYYDSLVAKVVAHSPTREGAITAMLDALAHTRVEGIRTTIPLHQRILQRNEFQCMAHYTTFVESAADLIEQASP
ncbi:MAG: acetyl-CoA carboxylase biotin carboxylase subunit [Actinobacteria bacterium]|nr:acetyl-CoA carboxylase biotin carboxylase subunit [Actinomycetota bacterium]